MSDRPAGSVFCFASGIYRMTDLIVPKDRDQFIGAGTGDGGTILTGAAPVRIWTRSGGLFVHQGQVASLQLGGECHVGIACRYPDWLFRNGLALRRVLAPCLASNVREGTFCIDYGSRQMYVHDDPNAARIEYSHVPRAFDGGTGVSIRTMAVDGYANTANGGAVIRAGSGWLVEGIEMSNNHACAIAMIGTSGTVVRNSRFHDNGQLGFCGSSSGARFVDNEVDHNNRMGFQGSWGGGGGKFTESVDLTVTGNNVHDNNGNGIWLDLDNADAVVTGNTVTGNTSVFGAGNGIDYEVSCHGTIDSNRVSGNAQAGILISNSHHVRVGSANGGNTVSNNHGFGIRILAGGRGGVQPHCGSQRIISAITVVGNDITMPPGPSWNGVDRQSPSVARGIRFQANRYHMQDAAQCLAPRWVWWNSFATYRVPFSGPGITWQGAIGQDTSPGGGCGV